MRNQTKHFQRKAQERERKIQKWNEGIFGCNSPVKVKKCIGDSSRSGAHAEKANELTQNCCSDASFSQQHKMTKTANSAGRRRCIQVQKFTILLNYSNKISTVAKIPTSKHLALA
jgi:hypothetical protein